MKGVRVGGIAREDLDGELFQIVQKTACRFVSDIEKLGRRYRRLRVTTDPVRLRLRVESRLMSLVNGHTPITRRKRNHKPSSKREVCVMDRRKPFDDEAVPEIIRVMPHDEGDYEVLLPDDPDPAEVVKGPSFWRRIIQHAVRH